ncbi:MAG: hypothetical protein BWY39_00588 [Spirochaetes bacterium ADurb.Bin269]|nr:MAG: hypothetical protein BWY39_00588 [Spirochaetes bacterium ADurb.Bin269]
MHVVFGFVRQIVVDDHRERIDVDAACGDVRRDEAAEGAGLERLDYLEPFGLWQVADDEFAFDAVDFQALGDDFAHLLGIAEHDQAFGVFLLNQAE